MFSLAKYENVVCITFLKYSNLKNTKRSLYMVDMVDYVSVTTYVLSLCIIYIKLLRKKQLFHKKKIHISIAAYLSLRIFILIGFSFFFTLFHEVYITRNR